MLALGIVVATTISLAGVRHYLIDTVDDDLKSSREQIYEVDLTLKDLTTFLDIAGLREALDPNVAKATDTNDRVFVPVTDAGKPKGFLGYPPTPEERGLAAAVGNPVKLSKEANPTDVELNGDTPYRATAIRLADGQLVLMATEVSATGEIMGNVVRLELVAGVGLMALLGTGMFFGARRGLRPMEDMVETASAIAEGCEQHARDTRHSPHSDGAGPAGKGHRGLDLSRRVAARGGRRRAALEVERLRLALNSMLHQVESAFLAREHAAAHLRRFVADASHELRTPLAAIRGYLQLYERGMLADAGERTRVLHRMTAETERMSRLVDELLALARLDQRPELRPAPVDVARLAEDALADLSAQQPEREVRFVRTEGPALALADEPLLRQVVGNLVANVRVHTPVSAPVRVEVSAGPDPHDADTHVCVLRVRDEGPGMRPEDAARVFDRFFRADGAPNGGSGLGMSVVHAGVEAQGGTVRVRTARDAGLTVTVTLPAPAPAPDTSESDTTPAGVTSG
ncbi:HAMP domain-containing histidine kinase [Streptomyces sp. SB3404]|uniref:Sensor-like histidine kinase SenX3 n=2 Tax=Streptomyces boncukensis TaxID=2711219 RepID=A0A6G4WVE0_9ACTN|nr:HAMP domain-containing histidine kinase [Streptomyces boncukensis]